LGRLWLTGLLSFCAGSYFDRQVRDAVLDFDAVVKNPAKPDELIPAYNCGDGVHPSPIGYFLMGKSVELGLFGAK